MPTESGSFGDWLRRQRELREISLRDIAERTKISLRYLEAMEADRFDLLPAPIFAKGFLREYARYVGLSPDDVVNHYLSRAPSGGAGGPQGRHQGALAAEAGRSRPAPVRRNWSWGLLLALAGLILLVLVALAAYFAERRHDEPANVGQAPPMSAPPQLAAPRPDQTAVPAAASARSAPPPPSAPIQVSLDFTKDCWVEAVIDGGKRRFSELRVQGESLPLEAEKSIVLDPRQRRRGGHPGQRLSPRAERERGGGGARSDHRSQHVEALKAKKEAR